MRINLWQVESGRKSAKVIQHCEVPGTNCLKLRFEFAEHFFPLFWALAATPAGSDRPRRLWGGLIYFILDLPLPVIGHRTGACHKTGRITLKLSCHGGCILLSKDQSLLML